MDTNDKIRALKSAGFAISYAERSDATEFGYLRWSDPSGYPSDDAIAYVSLEEVAAGEDAYDQVDTVRRSNYRTLKANDESRVANDDKPEFTDLAYANVTVLGAFVEDLEDDTISTLIGLKNDYPVLDESDMSELESEEIQASWDQYLDSDLYREIGKREMDEEDAALAGYVIPEGKLSPGQVELWQEKTTDERRVIFGTIIDAHDYYPEHTGIEVRWDYDQLTAWIIEWIKEQGQ